MPKMAIVDASALKYGALGLAFLLAFLAFNLLKAEQGKVTPRQALLRSTTLFMAFSLLLAFTGFFSEIILRRSTPAPSAVEKEFLESISGHWRAEGKDVVWPEVGFTPRHTYRGTLEIQSLGDGIRISGPLETFIGTNTIKNGKAPFEAQGVISGHQIAGHYDYGDKKVRGFGSFYFHSDTAGLHATMDVVFRPTTGDFTYGRGRLLLTRDEH